MLWRVPCDMTILANATVFVDAESAEEAAEKVRNYGLTDFTVDPIETSVGEVTVDESEIEPEE